MIHVLEVTPELVPAALKKLARKHAMTGGVELALRPDLTADDLERLYTSYAPEIEQYAIGTSVRRSNHAARILRLIFAAPETREDLRVRIASLLNLQSEAEQLRAGNDPLP